MTATVETAAETTVAAGTVIVDAAHLALALKAIKPAVGVKCNLPLLAHVHLRATGDDTLAVEATNLDLGLTATLDALTDGPLDVCLPYAALAKLIDPDRSGDVTISVEELASPDGYAGKPGKTAVSQGKRTARIDTISGADFPLLAAGGGADAAADVTLTAARWSHVRASLLPAAARDDSRPVLAGVYVACDAAGRVTLAAADGFRLALYDAGTAPTPFNGYIIPAHNLAAIPAKIDLAVSSTVDSGGATRARFHYSVASKAASVRVVGVSRCIDGCYPDVRQIVPTRTGHAFTVEVSAIQEARAFKPGNDVVIIRPSAVSCNAPGVGDIVWNGTTVVYEGDGSLAPGVALNAVYADWLADACGDGEHVTIRGSAPDSPWLAERDGLTCLLMPMVIG